jgi:RNA polymerase sigma factor (sigma-70 family)
MSDTPLSLLDRLRQRPDDGASWQGWVELYTPFLSLWLRRLAPDAGHHDGEDLIQNVLTVVVQKLPAFQHNGRAGAFRCWLKQILVNCLRDARRKAQPAAGVGDGAPLLAELEDPASGLSRLWDQEHTEHVVRQLLQRARGEFTPHVWQVFERVVLHGEASARVAADLKVTHDAVQKAKSRVLCWLRQECQELID